MYDPDYIRSFYDAYGPYEWLRFEDSAYGRLQAAIHSEFLARHVKSGDRAIDVGGGPGRFSIVLAELGARVTLLDISATQLALARENIEKAGKLSNVVEFVEDDITKFSVGPTVRPTGGTPASPASFHGQSDGPPTQPSARFEPGAFDVVVCLGGVLAYAYEKRFAAADNLLQLCKPDGVIIVSVPSRFGVVASVVRRADEKILNDPEGNHLWRILNDGDLPGWMSKRIGIAHPPMHLYTSWEIGGLFEGCTPVETVGCAVTAFEGQTSLDEMASDPARWSTLLNLERRLGGVPGMIDSGSLILCALRRTS